MRRKAEVQAPMASANDRIAAVEVTFRFINWRQPKMTSARRDSSQAMRRRSRLASRICRAEPKAWRTSAGSRPSRMPSARCEPSSSSISRSTRLPRNVLVMRDQSDISHRPQHSIYSRRYDLPAGFLIGELLLAGRSETIHPEPAPFVLRKPFGPQPAGFFDAVQGRIKRAFVGPQDVAGPVLNGRHDGVAVESGTARQDLQDEKVEGALEGIWFGHVESSQY